MKKTKFITGLTIIMFLIGAQVLQAKNYYISAIGKDSNKGTSIKESWETLENLKTLKLKPGDSILFRCGDIFRGEIVINTSGKEGKKIVFSSFGSGKNPVLSGAVSLTGWEKTGNNTYVASSEQDIVHLFVDDIMQTSARYPNNGYLFMDKIVTPRIVFLDDELKKESGYWDGAYIRYRPNDWTTRHGIVEAHEGIKITIKEIHSDYNKTSDNIARGSGYYFDNKFEELDSISEWYYNLSSKKVYYMPATGIDALKIEGVTFNDAFTLLPGVSNIEISNLDIQKYHHNGIYSKGANRNITIINNNFENINATAIHLDKRSGECLVKGNKLFNINGRGIFAIETDEVKIIDNHLENIGIRYGYGISGLNGMTGILLVNTEGEKTSESQVSRNNLVQYNEVINTGYNGIRLEGMHNVVKNNYVYNAMSLLNDGGGIYSWSEGGKYYVSDNIISGNIFDNVHGGHEGLISDFPPQSIAIYLDNRTLNTTVEKNVACNSLKGIFSNTYSRNNTFRNNIIYNTDIGFETADYFDPVVTYGHLVENNLFFTINMRQYAVSLVSYTAPSTDSLATFKNNKYYSMHERYFMREILETDNKKTRVNYLYQMEIWQEKLNNDINGFAKLYNHPWKKDLQGPYKESKIIYNASQKVKSVKLTGKGFFDLDGNKLPDTVEIEPYSAKIILMEY
jgi:hypothetical protein